MAIYYYAGFSILGENSIATHSTHFDLDVDDGTNSFTVLVADINSANGGPGDVRPFYTHVGGLSATISRYHEGLSPLQEYSQIPFAEALARTMNAEQAGSGIDEVWVVTYDVTTKRYTITTEEGTLAFTLDFNIPGAHLCGFTSTITSSATSHTGTETPWYVIEGTIGARTQVTPEYHPGGQSLVAANEDSTVIMGQGRARAVAYQDWLQPFEPRERAQRPENTAADEWNWPYLFEHAGGGAFPLLVVYGTGARDNVVCKLRGQPYRARRAAHDYDEDWHVPLRTIVMGSINNAGLMDFSATGPGSMSRASAATDGIGRVLDDTVTKYASNVHRPFTILGRNYVLIERSVENILQGTETLDNSAPGFWFRSGVASLVADDTASPDTLVTAEKIESNALGITGVYQVLAHAGITDDIDHTATLFCKPFNSSSEYSIQLRMQDLTTPTLNVDAATFIDGSWARAELTADVGNGANDILFRLGDHLGNKSSTTRYQWGAQFEEGSYATSYIVTTSAPATRAVEHFTFTDGNYSELMKHRKWAVVVMPLWDNTEAPNDPTIVLSTGTAAGTGFELRYDAAADTYTVFRNTGAGMVAMVAANALTFSRRQFHRIICHPAAGTIEVRDATTGDGLVTGTAWTGPDATMEVGNRPSADLAFDGLVSEPEAA